MLFNIFHENLFAIHRAYAGRPKSFHHPGLIFISEIGQSKPLLLWAIDKPMQTNTYS
jgi:hypothetical protein